GKINSRYTISRYWICWIARILAFNNLDIGNMNSTNTEKKCESVIENLANNTYTLDLFRNAIKIYDDCKREFKERNGRLRNAQLVRLKAFRELIKINLASYLKSQ
ncbi:AIPR family protein, partial [Escherichia coli]